MRRPVVASRLPLVERAFPPDALAVYEPGDVRSLAWAVLHVVDDGDSREIAVGQAADVVSRTAWETVRAPYLDLVERLTGDRPTS
jgi:hypothetical protein